jgi:hypothetical protein
MVKALGCPEKQPEDVPNWVEALAKCLTRYVDAFPERFTFHEMREENRVIRTVILLKE